MVCWSQRKAGQGEAVDPTSLLHLLMFKLWLFQIPRPAFSSFPLEVLSLFSENCGKTAIHDFWYVDSNLARQRLRDLEIEKLQGLRNDARHQWAELVRQRVIFLRLHCSCFVHVCDNHACTHYDPASNMT